MGLLFVSVFTFKLCLHNWSSESQFPRHLPHQSSLVPFKILTWHFYAKYCNSEGGSTSKKLEVVFPYKHVRMFLKRTLTMYCLPSVLIPSLIFFFIICEFKAFSYIAKKPLYGYPSFTHGFIKRLHLWGRWVVTVGSHQMWSKRIRRISINAKNVSSRCYCPSL